MSRCEWHRWKGGKEQMKMIRIPLKMHWNDIGNIFVLKWMAICKFDNFDHSPNCSKNLHIFILFRVCSHSVYDIFRTLLLTADTFQYCLLPFPTHSLRLDLRIENCPWDPVKQRSIVKLNTTMRRETRTPYMSIRDALNERVLLQKWTLVNLRESKSH